MLGSKKRRKKCPAALGLSGQRMLHLIWPTPFERARAREELAAWRQPFTAAGFDSHCTYFLTGHRTGFDQPFLLLARHQGTPWFGVSLFIQVVVPRPGWDLGKIPHLRFSRSHQAMCALSSILVVVKANARRFADRGRMIAMIAMSLRRDRRATHDPKDHARHHRWRRTWISLGASTTSRQSRAPGHVWWAHDAGPGILLDDIMACQQNKLALVRVLIFNNVAPRTADPLSSADSRSIPGRPTCAHESNVKGGIWNGFLDDSRSGQLSSCNTLSREVGTCCVSSMRKK